MARAKTQSAPAVKEAGSIHTANYRKVKKMFTDLAKLMNMNSVGKEAEKATLVAQICEEFTFRARFEDEIFYPAMPEASDDDDSLIRDEAGAWHTVQGENGEQRIEEKRDRKLPRVKEVKLDLAALGAPRMKRAQTLQESLGTRSAKKTARVA